ncbi:Zn(II)2Cys6 transcription factor [Aspergillus taichungensis]|uniref:Zn(II)2Cys6 transcription factor n=1 Tax=Aspergillus taichungensis TaxID=482145 RepID=A0A2J5I9X6_9EURO|nr:Zn(II)2Cys6 transcription factor [Aspergillus taichungensis]
MSSSSPSDQAPHGLPNLSPTSQFQYRPNSVSVPAPLPSAPQQSSSTRARGRQITRNRASYSCHTCRRRKVKCDKVHPICGNCVKNGTECIYDASSKTAASHDDDVKLEHGVKRRRETSRPVEDDIDDLESICGHLRQAESSTEQKYGSQAIEARLDKLTSMIERLSKTNQPLSPAERQLLTQNVDTRTAKGDIRSVKDSARKLSDASGASSSYRVADSGGDEFPIPAGSATDLVDPVGSLNLGHLSLEDGGNSRYVGTTYWAYISHEINELNQLLRDQNRSHGEQNTNGNTFDDSMSDTPARSPRTPWRGSVDSPSGLFEDRTSSNDAFQKSVVFPSSESPLAKNQLVEPEMLENVPSKRQSHILYRGFMSGVHAISPIVHPPTIQKLYNAFWDWYDYSSYSGEPYLDSSFIPLLYAIWYAGSVTISIRTIKSEFTVASRFALSKTYNEEVNRWLTRISFPRSPSLQGLAAYLLVQTILSKEEEPLASSLFVSLAMRVAQTMGLHRDPAKFGIQPYEAEYRRRIWWHIVHMDVVVSMSSGLPLLVSDENFWDVREASEVKDTLLGTPEAEEYEKLVAAGMRPRDNPDDPTVCGGSSIVNVYYLSARGKYVMASAIRRIMRIQLGTKPVTRQDMEELRCILLDLQVQLNSIIDRIPEPKAHDLPSNSNRSWSVSSRSPAEVRTNDTELPGDGPTGCSEQYHTPVLVAFHKWAKILLSLFIDKAFCVAYQPFLKNAKSRIWPAARQSALRHCHGFMEKFITFATDPDFQPFQWSWPGNHQPMHAAMIMLIDLYERPRSPEAPKSRAFIDKIFSLTGPDGGVVGGEDGISTQRPLKDGGREAWGMIRRLRQKAWQKAGLDPHMLWTEQAQVQAGAIPGPEDHYGSPSTTDSPSSSSSPSSPAGPPPLAFRRPPVDFSKKFYNMTRAHSLSEQKDATVHPSPLRKHEEAASAPATIPGTPQMTSAPQPAYSALRQSTSATATPPIETTTAPAPTAPRTSTIPNLSTPPDKNPLHPIPQQYAQPTTMPLQPFMEPNPPIIPAPAAAAGTAPPYPVMAAAPTPPSMVDPNNLNFDWDQWDAVFGQHLPVADELMELDPVNGLEFGDLGWTGGAGE